MKYKEKKSITCAVKLTDNLIDHVIGQFKVAAMLSQLLLVIYLVPNKPEFLSFLNNIAWTGIISASIGYIIGSLSMVYLSIFYRKPKNV